MIREENSRRSTEGSLLLDNTANVLNITVNKKGGCPFQLL
jgi:hypothetical protein